jgi:hypothetical protein
LAVNTEIETLQLTESGSVVGDGLYLSVLNRRHGGVPEGSIYVGRGTRWGNPFKIGRDGTRDEVIAKYEAWFEGAGLAEHLPEIRGSNLVCWCAPLRCHADFLLRRANIACDEIASVTAASAEEGVDEHA